MKGNWSKVVFGVGRNDADYVIRPMVDGKQRPCKIYQCWKGMLKRVYDRDYLKKNPSYKDVRICEEWHKFSVFRKWMVQQRWCGKDIDKELFGLGRKIYSPETCYFLPRSINNLLVTKEHRKGDWPLGVSRRPGAKKFTASGTSETGDNVHLGFHETPEDAHLAYLKHKRRIILAAAAKQDDEVIAAGLRRYAEFLPMLLRTKVIQRAKEA